MAVAAPCHPPAPAPSHARALRPERACENDPSRLRCSRPASPRPERRACHAGAPRVCVGLSQGRWPARLSGDVLRSIDRFEQVHGGSCSDPPIGTRTSRATRRPAGAGCERNQAGDLSGSKHGGPGDPPRLERRVGAGGRAGVGGRRPRIRARAGSGQHALVPKRWGDCASDREARAHAVHRGGLLLCGTRHGRRRAVRLSYRHATGALSSRQRPGEHGGGRRPGGLVRRRGFLLCRRAATGQSRPYPGRRERGGLGTRPGPAGVGDRAGGRDGVRGRRLQLRRG